MLSFIAFKNINYELYKHMLEIKIRDSWIFLFIKKRCNYLHNETIKREIWYLYKKENIILFS